jgi:endonuclease/exonuclease/phosphatase family metal-dependent hydrolase
MKSARFDRFSIHFSKRAPGLTGAVFCASFLFWSASCGKKGGTPDWDTPGGSAPAVEASTPAKPDPAPVPEPEPEPMPASEAPPADTTEPASTDPASASADGLRFIGYNVENWLTMDRFDEKEYKTLKDSPKPDSEKKALIGIIVKNSPDIVGLCEIGDAKDFAEIQESLKTAGLNLPHSHYTGGSDPTRHLAMLSRFPIISTAKPTETEYQMQGQTYAINRGILDATIEARGKKYRFLGVHLKSKREVDGIDQEEMRIHEARLLRRHVDSILQADAEARLVVYGDFNDTRATKAFKAVTGTYKDPGYLTAIPFKDSRGEAWTHYWALHDIYSRIDFVAVSRALRPEVDFRASHIIDDATWNDASDHRPLMAIFK